MKKILFHTIALFFLFSSICGAQQRDISITIDDLPLIELPFEMFENIVHSFVKHQVPAIGFVIGSRVNNETIQQFLLFKQNGLALGNHTYSHLNLKRVSCEEYINDIIKADKVLSPFMSQPKFFRYPYLSEGTLWRKSIVRHYLSNNGYIVAPVTIDSRDFEFNIELIMQIGQNPNASLTDLKKRYLEYVWQRTLTAERNTPGKQILLLHVNLLNAYFLDDLLQMFEDHGYHFISLNDALKRNE
ncbi:MULTISPECIES: polysaccharide deacetylase family protein [Legionella]|uniref:Polysaccharide deacetylase family protein n=1 Tax=Legionella resiliens TaxID=2905958 RepID=A0ABS8X0T6_9GAMM|nr:MULTISPECIES: polysaccharide deacetylase family protein [unclassified Legionella]MCE0722257.1 polysaccharide deacetylase family protein [Legionella sp. 9fVS26]MCE3531411.1 polysaccharide deacetylase family protein [Legionella sp. 8cVS16]QLZ67428.1 polysaccharide deacetylase [Legionella sp. PC1000]